MAGSDLKHGTGSTGEGPPTDDALYQRYLSGEESAGDELMLRYGNALTAYLDGFLHHAQDAEDLMLDCFAVILVRKPRIVPGAFRAYLFKTARNKANRLWRIRFRRRKFTLDETLPASDASSPEEQLFAGEKSGVLQRCLNRIAPQYREALWLFYDMGMSYAQAAEVLGCGEKRVEDLLRNGRKRLRLEMEKEGFTHADL